MAKSRPEPSLSLDWSKINARSWSTRVDYLDEIWTKELAPALLVARMFCTDNNPHVRYLAIDVLAEGAEQVDHFRVAESLTDTSWMVRQSAVYAIVSLRKQKAKDQVLRMLRSDRHEVVRGTAARALAEIEDADTQNVLREALGRERNPIAIFGIVEALVNLGQWDVLPVATQYLSTHRLKFFGILCSVLSRILAKRPIPSEAVELLQEALNGLAPERLVAGVPDQLQRDLDSAIEYLNAG